MKFYTRYDAPPSPQVVNNEPSMTAQRFKNECDINAILARYKVPANADAEMVKKILAVSDPAMIRAVRTGAFMDVSAVPDYAVALRKQREALLSFAGLPIEVRKEFGNNPEIFAEFVARSRPEDVAKIFGSGKESAQDTLDVTVPTDSGAVKVDNN